MGKSSAPEAPDYTKQAIATSNLGKYSEQGPNGSVGWSIRPGADPNNPQPGDYIRQTTLSGGQQQLYDQQTANQLQAGLAGGAAIEELGQGRQATQDALYRRGTQYYDQNFGDQEEALRTRLQNQGLAEGSQAYERELRNFGQTRNTAYADAMDRAIVGADQSQNSSVSRIAQLLAASKGQAPVSSNVSAGPDLLGAANQGYQAQVGANNASNAASGQTMSTIGSVLSAFLLSDRRLKSDVVPLGIAANGLPGYEYNIQGRRERGYMADEVELLYPNAVQRGSDGYLRVNYSSIGGRP